jgi:hypothetical protein
MRRQVLKQTDTEIKEIDEQIAAEMEAGIIADPAAEMDPAMAAGDPNAAPSEEQPMTGQSQGPDPADLQRGEI